MKSNFPTSHHLNTPISAILLFITYFACAQAPGIEWQNTIGGTGYDDLRNISITSDGGYIVSANSDSNISGDKTENSQGGKDIWILKLDANGGIEWQNTIGATGYDFVAEIQQTTDGGYIIGGSSNSMSSEDKSEDQIGAFDFWVIKLDNTGNITWENTIGGTGEDDLYTIVQTPDGGYILGGISTSNISVDKSEPSFGSTDYWLIKIDDAGNIQWQKTIGGSGAEDLLQILITGDGGYLLGGHSGSGISGLKSEPCFGGEDYWIVKTDPLGNIEWQNTIGGNAGDYFTSMVPASDGGYLLGGYSSSGISGDKTETSMDDDYWIVKINDAGNIEWQNTIGGARGDILNSIVAVDASGYLLGGTSLSGISGDKSENRIGNQDWWSMEIDLSGNIIWQNTLGGIQSDYLNSVQHTGGNTFLLGGISTSGVSGDKNEPVIGGTDFWIAQLSYADGACFAPLTISSIPQAEKAKIYWTAVEGSDGYKLRYRIAGTDTWFLDYIHGKEFTILKSLNCNTEYEYQLLSICSPDASVHSDYSPSRYFSTEPCRLDGQTTKGELNAFPNPASDKINILFSGAEGNAQILIFNLNGEIVYQNNINIQGDVQLSWDTENICNGIYQLQIMLNENLFSEKIVISK